MLWIYHVFPYRPFEVKYVNLLHIRSIVYVWILLCPCHASFEFMVFSIVWFYHVRVVTIIKATIKGNENFPSCKNDLGGESQFIVFNFTIEWVKWGGILKIQSWMNDVNIDTRALLGIGEDTINVFFFRKWTKHTQEIVTLKVFWPILKILKIK
jgi:hypothetical protein